MKGGAQISVEVAYATPERQEIMSAVLEDGATAYDAVVASGITQVFPEIDLEAMDLGIYGKVIKLPKTHPLRDGDRVEIYRPLKIDPKQARINRARKK
ncbi:RnfH family protein [Marinobacter sp. BGYM27]|uniref:RnfH family protein n=1 Tax=unclassified Marinobacter TaxID=83889 RepID=UPI0021A83B88|nr:RnfH family protein [Marinobacter sp. BGYM27]